MSVERDAELEQLVESEEQRQQTTLTLIASENYVFPGVYALSGSMLTNKYSEGRVGARYYGGTQWIDQIEALAQERALELFRLDREVWGVTVQPYSGSIANFSAYSAMTGPGGKIMGMDLPAGGHLTHGFQTSSRKVSGTSVYFTSRPYGVDSGGFIDYMEIEHKYNEFQPDILICGYSAHSQDIDYQRLKSICGGNSFLFADISHISALIAGEQMASPFEHCDVVMTTTHKGLRGPRGAMVFYRKKVTVKGKDHNMDAKINSSVFPLIQGGPHNQTIAGIAHAMKCANSSAFKEYTRQVVKNARCMAAGLTAMGYKVLTGTTVNHMLLLDLKNQEVSGADVEVVCEALGISINKNSVPGDASPMNPSGIRIGTYAITSRGMKEEECQDIVRVLSYAIKLAQTARSTSRTPKAWIEEVLVPRAEAHGESSKHAGEEAEFSAMREKIRKLAFSFPVPRNV